MNSDKKVREPNFSSSEKVHLMNIIANKYALILEDKNTDRASTSKKLKAWQKNVTPAERHNRSEVTLRRPNNGIPSTSKDWNKYTPKQFQTPINPALEFTESALEKDVSKDDNVGCWSPTIDHCKFCN
ncbi:hypothetical protein FQA39_LY18839 [Lamprigera yunnana]|nr:hypothetical protein FQA39_LY18839 [Lamprigera yunnana]